MSRVRQRSFSSGEDSGVPMLHRDKCRGSNGDINRMQQLIDKWGPYLIERKQKSTGAHEGVCSALLDAVIRHHESCVRYLLSKGADVNSLGPDDNPALFHAIFNTYAPWLPVDCTLFDILLEAGADVNRYGHQSGLHAPIYILLAAMGDTCIDLIKKCFKFGANPNGICTVSLSDTYRCPFVNAICVASSLKMLELFLNHGACPDNELFFRNWNDNCDIHFLPTLGLAMLNGKLDSAKLLLLYNASPQIEHIMTLASEDLRHFSLPVVIAHSKKSNTEMKIKFLYMLHKFGAKFWNYVTVLPKVTVSEEREDFDQLMSTIHQLCQPLTLKQLSRVAILKVMGARYLSLIHQLELPRDLHEFLEFRDV